MYLDVIADYGTRTGVNDLAFSEVLGKIYEAFDACGIAQPEFMAPLSVSPLNPIETSFVIAQLGLNSKRGSKHIIYHNTAPRKDQLEARPNNNGEELAVCHLPNGVYVIGVNSKPTFSFLAEKAPVYKVNCPNEGTQFRSRDIYPKMVAELAGFISTGKPITEWSFVAEQLDVAKRPENVILSVDGYGNLKTALTELPQTDKVKVTIAGIEKEAMVGRGIFGVKDGTLALAHGSSGWDGKNFLEVVLRGGSAWDYFGQPHVGQRVLIG